MRYQQPRDETSVKQVIADVRRALRQLQTGQRIGFTGLPAGQKLVLEDGGQIVLEGGGQISSYDPSGTRTLYIGPVGVNVEGQGTSWTQGFLFRRASGKIFFALFGWDPDSQFWAFYDEQDNIILSSDTISGMGLARPWLPVPMLPQAQMRATATTTLTDVFHGEMSKQHPWLRTAYKYYAESAAGIMTVEIWATTGGTTTLLSTTDYTNQQGVQADISLPPGGFGDMVEIQIKVKKSINAGLAYIELWDVYGIQST